MSEQQTTLLNCEYFPSINWYRDFVYAEKIVIEQFENFVRTTERNRCHVTGPNGKITLTVPLLGGRNQRSNMKDIKVANQEKWQHQHWGTLDACYRRTPFFEYFEPILQPIFLKQYNFLLDLNLDTLQVINNLIKYKKEFSLSEKYYDMHERHFIDKRSKHAVEANEISYLQPFQDRNGFISGLSILDLLFCAGNQAVVLLSNSSK